MSVYFRSNNISALRGGAVVAGMVLFWSLFEAVGFATDFADGLAPLWMILLPVGLALMMGVGHVLQSSVEVIVEEERIRIRHGWDILSRKWRSVRLMHVHSADLALSESRNQVFAPGLELRYRWPEKKMMAVPLRIPLAHIKDRADLVIAIGERIDVQWRLFDGENNFRTRTWSEVRDRARYAL